MSDSKIPSTARPGYWDDTRLNLHLRIVPPEFLIRGDANSIKELGRALQEFGETAAPSEKEIDFTDFSDGEPCGLKIHVIERGPTFVPQEDSGQPALAVIGFLLAIWFVVLPIAGLAAGIYFLIKLLH